ncbi:MAG: MMPL family transporter [Candidatus Thiodiazotropha sp. (ex Lucinoma borealis)]|nr:MMPL family transporter [Candidatus Thiodiazotropha sp. (ex Lucinoma borealis)]MCU7867401.1 MMPL family transporter [Candidatus Thiodiazotropha sp. (ex Lucinoma borealis)]
MPYVVLRWLFWSTLSLLSIAYISTVAKTTSDISQFLPGGDSTLIQALNTGPNSRLLLISLSNASPQDLATLNIALARSLSSSNFFSQIINGIDNNSTQLRKFIYEHRYLLYPSSSDDFSSRSIETELKLRLKELSSSLSSMPGEYVRSDPTGITIKLLTALNQKSGGLKYKHQVLFTEDENNSLLFVWLKHGNDQLDKQEQALLFINQNIVHLNHVGASVNFFGYPSIAIESKRHIKGEVQRLTTLGSLFIFIFMLLVYRSIAIAFLITVPLVSGVLAGIVAVQLLHGEIHGITLAFGITLLGITIDYPIHVFTHMQSNRYGKSKIWGTIYLGMVTTIIGFSSLMISSFVGLQQLGIFACAGLLTAVIATRYLLNNPRDLIFNQFVQNSSEILFRRLRDFQHPRSTLIIITLCASIFVGLTSENILQTDIRAFNNYSKAIHPPVQIADTGRLIIIESETADSVLNICETLTAKLDDLIRNNHLYSYEAPCDYIPSTIQQLKNLNSLPELSQLNDNIRVASKHLPFKADTFTPFITAISNSKYQNLLNFDEFKNTLLHTRASQRIYQNNLLWTGLINLTDVSNEQAVLEITEQHGPMVKYINVANDSSTIILKYQYEMISLCFLGFGFISLVLIIKSGFRRTAIILLPICAALSLTLVLLVLLGHKLTIFHIASLLLVLGLSLDYSLFSQRLNTDNFTATVTSLVICSISTIFIFTLLASSSIIVLKSIGMTVAIGTLLGFIFSALISNPIPHTNRL